MNYHTVYDPSQVAFQWWFPAIGLIFIVVGRVLIHIKSKSPKQSERIFASGFFGFGVIWTTLCFLMTAFSYWIVKSAVDNGQIKTVEGPVEDFTPAPFAGHKREKFTVGGRTFEYSDYVVNPAFHQTESHGGPIHAGEWVRIGYVGPDIVKIEIADASKLTPKQKRQIMLQNTSQ